METHHHTILMVWFNFPPNVSSPRGAKNNLMTAGIEPLPPKSERMVHYAEATRAATQDFTVGHIISKRILTWSSLKEIPLAILLMVLKKKAKEPVLLLSHADPDKVNCSHEDNKLLYLNNLLIKEIRILLLQPWPSRQMNWMQFHWNNQEWNHDGLFFTTRQQSQRLGRFLKT